MAVHLNHRSRVGEFGARLLRVKGPDTMAPLGPGLVTGWEFRGIRPPARD